MRFGHYAFLFVLASSALGLLGCSSSKTVNAFKGAPPANPAVLSVDGGVRFTALDGEPVERFAKDSAPSTPPADVVNEKNPRRKLRIDPGEHVVTVGLAREWMPLKRETHIGLVILTGAVEHSTALYPGSDEDVQLRFTAEPGRRYSIRANSGPQGWNAWIVEGKSGKKISEEIARVPYEDGSPLSPGAWIVERRRQEDSVKQAGADDLTKPRATQDD